MHDLIIILDFGSQYSQLIARCVREHHVYAELFPWHTPADEIMPRNPKGFILSGGPASVYAKGAPKIPAYVLESGLPILGICYGMQALTQALGGRVAPSEQREYGMAELNIQVDNPLIPRGQYQVWMSHGDRITKPPPDFTILGSTDNAPIAIIGDVQRGYYGVQFHPEVHHTPYGKTLLRNFVLNICGAQPTWTPKSIIQHSIEQIKAQVGKEKVLAAVSGGVDSSVAASLVHRAIGEQLEAIFIDTGLLRLGEPQQVIQTFRTRMGDQFHFIDASDEFMSALHGITNPEEKRRIIGELFIRTFESAATELGNPPFLVQGTIYPDVVESSAPDRAQAQRIKTHHNVGGLPEEMQFKLVEPLRYLFKDEVRQVGEALGLPRDLIWRQPFPGPGLAVRCLGEITPARLEKLRLADAILREELNKEGLLQMKPDHGEIGGSAQAFAVLLPVRSVGVMGDQRTYQEVIAIRAVTTEDFMTADWARLPHHILARISNRIVNEVDGINRVVYDITSKPPATIEWE